MDGMEMLLAALQEAQFTLTSIVLLSIIGLVVGLMVATVVVSCNAVLIWFLVDAIRPNCPEINPMKPKISNRSKWIFVVGAAILAAPTTNIPMGCPS